MHHIRRRIHIQTRSFATVSLGVSSFIFLLCARVVRSCPRVPTADSGGEMRCLRAFVLVWCVALVLHVHASSRLRCV
jgi:hypothetical protein